MDTLVKQDEFFVNCCPILGRESSQEVSRVGDTTLRRSKKGKANSSIEATTRLDRRRNRESDIRTAHR
jgi:hypothetical protein